MKNTRIIMLLIVFFGVANLKNLFCDHLLVLANGNLAEKKIMVQEDQEDGEIGEKYYKIPGRAIMNLELKASSATVFIGGDVEFKVADEASFLVFGSLFMRLIGSRDYIESLVLDRLAEGGSCQIVSDLECKYEPSTEDGLSFSPPESSLGSVYFLRPGNPYFGS